MLKRLTAACLLSAALAAPTAAQDGDDALVTFQVLSPGLALELAQATLADCNERGFQVAVAVVDRFGVPQVMLRDRFAGPHTPDTAFRKAWTTISFRTDTLELAESTASGQPQSGARDITNALMLGGAVMIEVGGQMVGAVAVSGAPSGEDDAACAEVGIEAIQDKLPL